jgi:N-acetylglucosaminyldiphosphoundecaprenol N-acetyl-beta-D-mannosaminyltransferase
MSGYPASSRYQSTLDVSAGPLGSLHPPAAVRHNGTARPTVVDFCALPLTVGLTVDDAVELAFSARANDLPLLTTFINPHSFHIVKHHTNYAANLAEFAFIFPDGIGIVWGLRHLTGINAERISFDTTSLALPVLKRASRESRSVMLIGGRPGLAAQAAGRLAEAVEGLRIAGAMDGFCNYTEYEGAVRAAKPDIIICGMGAPRQEELLVRLRRGGAWKGLGYTCGGYFDQLQKGLNYYPLLINKLNLRWLYRMIKEPRRLCRRYVVEYQQYAVTLASHSLKKQRGSPGAVAARPTSDSSTRVARAPGFRGVAGRKPSGSILRGL